MIGPNGVDSGDPKRKCRGDAAPNPFGAMAFGLTLPIPPEEHAGAGLQPRG
jgi:hypothetical protein